MKRIRTGQLMSAFVALFMVFDPVIHIMRIAPVVDGFAQLGYPLRVGMAAALLFFFVTLRALTLCS